MKDEGSLRNGGLFISVGTKSGKEFGKRVENSGKKELYTWLSYVYIVTVMYIELYTCLCGMYIVVCLQFRG